MHQYAQNLGIDEDIYWQVGPIRNMGALWERADIYIRPTRTDGDSVAVREALDAGVKVVASDVCKRPEGCLTYTFGDARDLLEKSLSVLAAKQDAVSGNPTQFYESMLKIYKECLL